MRIGHSHGRRPPAGHARDTIIARYSKTVVKRAYAVRNLQDHFASLCNTQHRDAIPRCAGQSTRQA